MLLMLQLLAVLRGVRSSWMNPVVRIEAVILRVPTNYKYILNSYKALHRQATSSCEARAREIEYPRAAGRSRRKIVPLEGS